MQKEGSLSIPDIYEPVMRPWQIQVDAIDLNGDSFSEVGTGWHARNLMHQNDSLNGILFIDRLDLKTKRKTKPLLSTTKKNSIVSFRSIFFIFLNKF